MSSGGLASMADPLNLSGKSSSSIKGNMIDPMNLFGNNPQVANNARIRGSAPPPGIPTTLPTLAGNYAPRLYDPASFTPRAAAGPGQFNTMAAQLAGPVYDPRFLGPSVAPAAGAAYPATSMPVPAGMHAGMIARPPLPYMPTFQPGYPLMQVP